MSFKIGIPDQVTIGYNYYKTSIRKNQYENTVSNSRYVKSSYTARTNEPNISFLKNGYIGTSISIVQKIHIIDGVDYDATLVIEHKSVTNKTKPFYVCFLLKTEPNVRTSIDDFFEGKRDVDIILNGLITSDTAILYENNFVKPATVAIFTTPILVGSAFSELRPGLFYIAPYSETFSTVSVEPILGDYSLGGVTIEGFQEGVTQMAGYCTPISETDPDIANNASILLGPDSHILENTAINSTLKTAINFFGFFILMLFIVFAAPAAHRGLLIELVLDNETFDAQRKLNRMSAVDMATSIIFFCFAFAFINFGIMKNNSISVLIGFYTFMFFLGAFFTLQFRRISDPNAYLEQFGQGANRPSFEAVSNDLGGLIMDNVKELLYKRSTFMDNGVQKSKFTFSSAGLMLAVLVFLYNVFLWKYHMFNMSGTFFFISIPVALFFIAWYLVVLVNHFWYKYTRSSHI